MDPNAAYVTMMDEAADPRDRQNAAQVLLDWIEYGGFLPDTPYHASTLLRMCRRIAWNAAL